MTNDGKLEWNACRRDGARSTLLSMCFEETEMEIDQVEHVKTIHPNFKIQFFKIYK